MGTDVAFAAFSCFQPIIDAGLQIGAEHMAISKCHLFKRARLHAAINSFDCPVQIRSNIPWDLTYTIGCAPQPLARSTAYPLACTASVILFSIITYLCFYVHWLILFRICYNIC